VLDVLYQKIGELAGTLVNPIWKRILALSWIGRFAILLFMLGSVLIATHVEQAMSLADEGATLARVGWAASSKIPLAAPVVAKVSDTAKRIAASLEADLGRPGQKDTQVWPIAQAAVGSHGLVDIDWDYLIKFMRASAEPDCNCWKDYKGTSLPRNIPASGWVIFCLAEIDTPATSGEINFLLDEQASEGWWSVFPVDEGDGEYASTYGTSWALLALQNQLSKKLIGDNQIQAVSAALSRGASWLLAKRTPGARWKDYPLNPNGRFSESLSGLALHTLHTIAPNKLRSIDQEWLDNLPESAPSASDADNDYYWIHSKDGNHLDGYVQVRLPWMLIATVDAYPIGNILQRAKALQWLESAVQQQSVEAADTEPTNWWRAELLYALKHVLKSSAVAEPSAP
jgi:hypothetical protein